MPSPATKERELDDARPFEALEGYRYLRLTTYRKSGEGVPTPVWFALVGGRICVFTGLESGKVKRIRNDPRVTLAPSDWRGRPKGVGIRAEARLMDGAEEGVADRAIGEKYGWQYGLFGCVLRLPRNPPEHVFLELRPGASD